MKRRILILLLAAVLAVISFDITAFAAEKENEEIVCAQEETETDAVEELAEQTEQVGEAEVVGKIGETTDTRLTEGAVEEEIKTTQDEQKEVFSESIDVEDTMQMTTEAQNDCADTDQNEETVELSEDVGENDSDISVEETKEQIPEVEEAISSVDDESYEEIQTEEIVVGSSAGLNAAMKNKILSLKSKYPEGKNWDPSGNGWCNLAWECYGFVITIEGMLFKDYPVQKHLRSTANGTTVEGWTCYYVTDKNYNSLVVEPGDVLDCPTSTKWNHTAMVLSVDNGKITCVQANYNGNNLVYWTQCFNYNTRRSTLKNIYNDYSKYITGSGSKVFRLWKPSEALKIQATGYSETPAASTLKISGQTSPGSLKTGERWTCTGTISSNYIINQVSGYILADNNSTVLYSKTINPNATSYSLANGEIDRALLFNMLPAGTYYYKITAQDASGKQLTLLNDKFTVISPVPKPCNFSGQITAPADWAAFQTSTVKITATATDSYAINNFIVKLYNSDGITLLKTETAAANKSGDAYLCNYDLNLSDQKIYTVAVSAICANGREHFIDRRHFTYDATPPVISNLNVYEESGDFYCTANVSDSVTGVVNAAMVIRDEGGIEKNFDCKIVSDTVVCIWSDINGLWTSGKYVITLYVQDKAGNIGYAALQDIVLAEVSSGPKRVDIVVGEEKEVNISINTLFKTEGKNQTQKTDKGMKAVIKGTQPGCNKFSFEWTAKNNAFATDHNYDIYVYTVPQSPKITKLSDKMEGYDVITYEPVQHAKTYELYRKRIGIDADYIPYEEFTDNKSHSIVVEHMDKGIIYYYRIRAKADESIDLATNEKYYPVSVLSNELHSEERGETEESSGVEESDSEESTFEDASSEEEGDITDGLYISGLQTKTYTGSAIKQDIKVYYNKVLLKEGKDYTASYKNNKNAGTALLTIKAKGNLTGSITKSFTIEPREINDRDVIIEDTVYIHDNKAHKKAPKVTYRGKALKEKKDFEVTSFGKGNYTSAGTYTAAIKGIGNFKGSVSNAKIIIVDKDKNIGKATLEKIPVQEYQNGAEIKLPDKLIKVTLAKTVLKKDVDYTVSYVNNIYPGKATLIIKGKGEYAGTKKVSFTIKRTPTVLTQSMITNKYKISTVKMQKNGVMPKPRLAENSHTLIEGKDYVLSYKNNKQTGTGIIIIKGLGNYTGSLTIPFNIKSKDLTSSDISIHLPNVAYNGKANQYQSNPVITDSDGGILVKNKDYTIEAYSAGKEKLGNNSSPKEGTEITVTLKGTGNYTGTIKATYMLKGISLSKAVIKIAPQFYTGSCVEIEGSDITSAVIKDGKTKKTLKLGTDYEIAAYRNNVKKGTATVIFKGIGDYAGEKKVQFKILPTAITGKNGRVH